MDCSPSTLIQTVTCLEGIQGAEDPHELLEAAPWLAVLVLDVWRLQQLLDLLNHVTVRLAVKGPDALHHTIQWGLNIPAASIGTGYS